MQILLFIVKKKTFSFWLQQGVEDRDKVLATVAF